LKRRGLPGQLEKDLEEAVVPVLKKYKGSWMSRDMISGIVLFKLDNVLFSTLREKS